MFLKKCQAILKIIPILHTTNLQSSSLYSTTWLSVCDIRLPVTVSNRLNAWQSKIFTKFQLKSTIKPMESTWCFLRNVKWSLHSTNLPILTAEHLVYQYFFKVSKNNYLIWPRPKNPEEDNCIKNPHYMHVHVSTYVLINWLHDVLLLRLVYNYHFHLPSQL